MDIKNDCLCEELRNLLGAWHGALLNPEARTSDIERLRRKIHKVCDELDTLAEKE